jgi:ribonuclease P protein component
MISSKFRFHGYGSLKRVFGRGQTIRGQLVSLKYVLNDRRKDYRLAVVVSKKVNKSAVVRNRIRRRIYEIVRHFSPDILEPYDIVITVYHEQVAAMSPIELEQLIRGQLKQANILNSKK